MLDIGYWIKRCFLEKPVLRHWITRVLEGDQDCDIEVFGTRLRINTIKEHGYLRAARKVRSSGLLRDEVGTIISLALLLSPGDSFVDVGANVGVFVCTLARVRNLHDKISFYAFEANPDTFGRLFRSTAGLNLVARNVAISSKSGELTFIGGAVSHVFTTVERAKAYNFDQAGQRVTVMCRRLDEFPFSGDSLVIKIDVEGQERAVLDGASELLERDRIKAIFIDGYEDQRIPDVLREYGFSLFDGRTLVPADGTVFGLLAVKKPKLLDSSSSVMDLFS